MDIHEVAINRIKTIIEETSTKLKIAICLPIILKHAKVRNLFTQNFEEIDSINKIYDNINWNQEYSSTEKFSSKDASQASQLSSAHSKAKLHLSEIIKFLYEHKDKINPIIDIGLDEMSENSKNVIEHIQSSTRIVEWQMRMTPKLLREYKAKLCNAKVLITISQEEIKKLESEFNDQALKHRELVKEFQDEIINLNLIIDEIKKTRNEELDREINSYKMKLRGLREQIDEKENNLRDQLEAHEAILEELTLLDIEQEKLLGEDCKKAEKKCLAALNAYDNDMNKLDELKVTLELQLRTTNEHYDVLKSEFETQDVLFSKLKKERELAMMQAFAQQMDNFEKSRAARVIQRTWRAYRERKSLKRKKRTRRKK